MKRKTNLKRNEEKKCREKLISFPVKLSVSLSLTHMQIQFSSSVHTGRTQQHTASPLASDCCRNLLKHCRASTFRKHTHQTTISIHLTLIHTVNIFWFASALMKIAADGSFPVYVLRWITSSLRLNSYVVMHALLYLTGQGWDTARGLMWHGYDIWSHITASLTT